MSRCHCIHIAQPLIEDGIDVEIIDQRCRRVTELFALCQQAGLNFLWVCMGRVDRVLRLSNEILDFLKQRGLVGIYFGIESGSQKILNLIDKGITPEMVLAIYALPADETL